jgi:molybdate/tungstate transport system substrate-binding protein
MKQKLIVMIFTGLLLAGCGNPPSGDTKEIIVFHAGSLSVPFRHLKIEYEKKNPGIKILLEPAGSLVCARKITELKKPCDIMASADYLAINQLLMPQYTGWSLRFATNEIVIAYHAKSRHSAEVNKDNWFDILSKDDVIYSRSDPDSDPCGYRTVLMFMLAEKYYNKKGLTDKMVLKNKDFIRPKEVDLIALIESNAIDYMFQYKSVAIQHGLKYVELPDEINLSDPSESELYKSVSIEVTGSKPGTKMKVTGEYINYSITVLDRAPQKEAAIDFLCFIVSKEGLEIFKKNGQDPIIPVTTDHSENIPAKLLVILAGNKAN